MESLSNRRVQVCNCLLGSRPLQVSIKSKVTGRGGMIYSNEARHSFRGSVLDPSEPFLNTCSNSGLNMGAREFTYKELTVGVKFRNMKMDLKLEALGIESGNEQ